MENHTGKFKNNNLLKAKIAEEKSTIELVSENDSDSNFFRLLERKGIRLNLNQLVACRHIHGPLLTLAGAGSGKTMMLIARAAYLVHSGVHPQNILLMTFTNKAAKEMKVRIQMLTNKTISTAITAGTFHSIFLKLLRHENYSQQLLTNDKYKQIQLKLILKEMGLDDSYQADTLLSTLSYLKNKIIDIKYMIAKTPAEKKTKHILCKYEEWKENNNYMDFDDVLLKSYLLLKQNTDLLNRLQRRFTHIMVDEFQDTNPLQYELIKMLAQPQNNLMVVGDEKQTIYSFNSADHRIILNFDKEFAAKTVNLNINYRSTSSIVGLGNEIIKHNQTTRSGDLYATKESSQMPYYSNPDDTDAEAVFVIDEIKQNVRQGVREYKDFAILHRTAASSRSMFEQLVINNIPFVSYGSGDNFYEQSIVVPVLSHMRLVLNPSNLQAIESILPSLYLRKEQAIRYVNSRLMANPNDIAVNCLANVPNIKPIHRSKVNERISLIQNAKQMPPQYFIRELRQSYDKFVEASDKQRTSSKEVALEILEELEQSAKRFETIASFLEFVDTIIERNKEMNEWRNDPDSNVVSLMTIHKSKGLEFPVVFVIGASDTIIPHSNAINADTLEDLFINSGSSYKVEEALEEERRLFYVAVTRAEESLYISSPQHYRGKKMKISRFLLDVFPPDEKEYRNESRMAKSNEQSVKKESSKEELVWDCTNEYCIAWIRLNNIQDREKKSRACPLCREQMVKRVKEVVVK